MDRFIDSVIKILKIFLGVLLIVVSLMLIIGPFIMAYFHTFDWAIAALFSIMLFPCAVLLISLSVGYFLLNQKIRSSGYVHRGETLFEFVETPGVIKRKKYTSLLSLIASIALFIGSIVGAVINFDYVWIVNIVLSLIETVGSLILWNKFDRRGRRS